MRPVPTITPLLCALAAACAIDTHSSSSAELDYVTTEPGDDVDFACEDPPEDKGDTIVAPYQPDPTIGTLTTGSLTEDGAQVVFYPEERTSSWIAKVAVDLGGAEDGPDRREYADVTAYNSRMRIVTERTPLEQRQTSDRTVLDAGRLSLDEVQLIARLQFRSSTGGGAVMRPIGFDLTSHSGRILDGHGDQLDLDFKAPLSCEDEALARFGKPPSDMPAVKFPIIRPSCGDGEKCIRVALAWVESHHHVWRANQMMEILGAMHPESRPLFWGQPGLDKSGQPLGEKDGKHRSSPKYWYGAFTADRFAAIKQAHEKYWKIMRTARTDDGAIQLRFRCPTQSGDENSVGDPGNICFTSYKKPSAHHVTKGWINMCPKVFDESQTSITRTLAHEVLHHVFVKYEGVWVGIRDVWTHWHGNSCATDPDTESMYGEDRIRHLATYLSSGGKGCSHRDIVLKTVDAHMRFANTVGGLVRKGTMWWWPAPVAEPTPQPPTCVGDPGCLCSELPPFGESPDGDYSIDQYCGDHDGVATCVETAVNAGAITGICKRCEDERGPGCECNKFSAPCDVGECFGDDTWGYASGTGHCYKAQPSPPSWACLADCQRMFNDDQAWCYHDAPTNQARCMDSNCPEPKAWECLTQGKVCRDGECVQECGYIGSDWVSCADLGYPPYYECNDSFLCEHSL